MKKLFIRSGLLAVAGAILLGTNPAVAQDSMVVTSDGVVQQIVPGSSQILVSSSTSSDPVKYTYSKSTTFVDAAGNQVTYESIKQNSPARIYYTKVGDTYMVTKFVVNPTSQSTTTVTPVEPVISPTPATRIIEETTTTTTTSEDRDKDKDKDKDKD